MPNKILSTLTMPVGRDIKNKLDQYLNDYINVPLSEAGHADTGAALSAALSAAGEVLLPDNLAEAALYMLPGSKLISAGKGMKKLIPGLEKAGVIDYKAISAAEKEAGNATRKAAEAGAETLQYDSSSGEIMKKIRQKPKPELE